MKKILGEYQNGNYTTTIFSDGTKIRMTDEDKFIPAFAECIDLQISNKCNNGCKYCYANCTPNGEVADLKEYILFYDSLHPYTELSINMNFPLSDDFEWFLEYLKEKKIVVNATINQEDFAKNMGLIYTLIDQELIYGLGVSWVRPYGKGFINIMNELENAVIHVVSGIVDKSDIEYLADNNLKILILGYKDIGRGIEYHKKEIKAITTNQQWLHDNINFLFEHFNTVAFDNLAIKQLEVKKILSDREWNEFYSGDDGQFTYYLDLVDKTFSLNSLANEKFKMLDTADKMFDVIKYIKVTHDAMKRWV